MVKIIAFFAILFVAVPSGFGGDLFGVVTREPAEAKKPHKVTRYRSIAAVEEQDKADCQCNPRLYSVVALYPKDGEKAAVNPRTDTLKMAQRDKMFEPSVIALPLGSTISFPNLDPFYHNVFSYSKTKKFDLGKYPRNETRFITFDKPGVVQVFCEIHYSMRAYVHILETDYIAVSNDHGEFSIKNIPNGDYRMTVWQEGLSELERSVTINQDSTWLEIR